MANARVTRQFQEAMVRESAKIQVPRQFLMVLQKEVADLEESASNTLNLSSVAHGTTGILIESATSNLAVSDIATYKGILGAPASNALSLSGNVTFARNVPVSAGSTLTLTSVGGRSLAYGTSSTLELEEIMIYINYVDDRKPVGNTLTLSQLVEAKGSRTVDHDLGLVQTVNVQAPIKPQVVHILNLVSHTSTPHRAFITQNLYATQFLITPLPTQHVTQNLGLAHDSPIGLFEQTLNLTQDVAVSFSLTAANTLNMADELDRTVIYIREVEHDNVIGHALTWYEDSPCGRKNYAPFQGENTIPGAAAAPRNTLQDPQGDTGNFSLYTPYLGVPTSKVVLRAPELDNRDRNAYSRVNSETRGGKLVVYADPIWPKVRTLVVTIVGLTEVEVDEFQDFMEETLGQEIGLTDWEGRLWQGYIKNPNEPAVQDGRERWTVSFEFEGEMLTVEQPGNEDGNGMDLNITQSVVAVIV